MKKANRLIAFLLLAATACAGEKAPAAYGSIVRFSKNHAVVFSDFTMTYTGERKVVDPKFKPGFTFYDFEVKSAKGSQTVSWTSGTGIIDSASFVVDGKPYELELRGSVLKKGWLRDDEMVVWPQAQFMKALEKRNNESR
ncbi:MAG: hypothetical protein ACREKL_12435 [Chthoniobacterales bacterium]